MKKSNKIKLDTIFSIYIRKRDANKNGYCKCISCGRIYHWKNMDAGHFVNRKHMSVRYNEQNVNAQCRACNRFDEGNIPAYALNLIKLHGEGVIQTLLWKKNITRKITDFEAETLISKYKEIVKELDNEKNL